MTTKIKAQQILWKYIIFLLKFSVIFLCINSYSKNDNNLNGKEELYLELIIPFIPDKQINLINDLTI